MIKWHDLTEHPGDLPKLNADGSCKSVAIVVVNEKKEEFGYVASYRVSDRSWVYYESDMSVTINDSIKVSRWAYLDGDGEEASEPSPQHDLTKLRDALIKGTVNVADRTHEFATSVKKSGDSFSEALTCALIGYMSSEVRYGIMKEFAEYGE